MKQFTLKLDATQQRPTILLKNALTALLDTGAYIPIWTDSEEILVSKLGATLVKEDVPFTGFGGTAKGNLYQVTLEVGDLVFSNMHIIANRDLETSYNLILSATMFDGLSYEINTRTHRLNVTVFEDSDCVRELRVLDSEGKIHVLCSSGRE